MSIYEKTPAYCERVAHIAEKAMPICKGMAKLYLMFHEKTTTVFERRKHMKKILCLVSAMSMVLAFVSTAMAASFSSGGFSNQFQSTDYLGKQSGQKWGASTSISLSSLGGTISVQPVNELTQASGNTVNFTYATSRSSTMTNRNYNRIHVLVKNTGTGTASVIGTFQNSAS